MTTNVRGFGFVGIRTDDNKYLPLAATTFNVTSEVTFEDIDGHPRDSCGDAEIFDTVQTSPEVYTVTLGAKKLDRVTFELFATGAKRGTNTNIIVPKPTSIIVPVDGIMTVADIDSDQVAYVTVADSVAPGDHYLTQQSAGTGVTATTFESGAGTISVHTSLAGKKAFIWYAEEEATLESIGGYNAIDKYNEIEIYGKVCGNEAGDMYIHLPKCLNTSGVNLNAVLDEQTKAFRPVIASERGFSAVYHMW